MNNISHICSEPNVRRIIAIIKWSFRKGSLLCCVWKHTYFLVFWYCPTTHKITTENNLKALNLNFLEENSCWLTKLFSQYLRNFVRISRHANQFHPILTNNIIIDNTDHSIKHVIRRDFAYTPLNTCFQSCCDDGL